VADVLEVRGGVLACARTTKTAAAAVSRGHIISKRYQLTTTVLESETTLLTDGRQQDLVAAGVLLHERRDVVHLSKAAAAAARPGASNTVGVDRRPVTKYTYLAGDDEPAVLAVAVLPHLLERVNLPSRHMVVGGLPDRDED
jgi:hypothetical protein